MPYISGRFRCLRWCFVPGDGPDSQHHQGSDTRRAGGCVDKQTRSWCHKLVELKSHLNLVVSKCFKHEFYWFISLIWDVIRNPLTSCPSFFKMVIAPPTSDSWRSMHMAPGHGASIRWYDWYVVVDGEFRSLSTYWVMWAAGSGHWNLLWVWFLCNHQNIWRYNWQQMLVGRWLFLVY